MTRTDMLALFAAYTTAESERVAASLTRFATLAPSSEARAAVGTTRAAAEDTYTAMLDAIAGLDIPA